jgi:hypothetical protein
MAGQMIGGHRLTAVSIDRSRPIETSMGANTTFKHHHAENRLAFLYQEEKAGGEDSTFSGSFRATLPKFRLSATAPSPPRAC